MSQKIEFGSREAAKEARDRFEEYRCPEDDDKRRAAFAVVDDTPEDVVEEIKRMADRSRGGESSTAGQADLTDAEKEQVDFSEINPLKARRAKAVFLDEGVSDWLTHWSEDLKTRSEWREAAQQAKQDSQDKRMDADEMTEDEIQDRAGDAARRARGGNCDRAHDFCEDGDQEACRFLREECGYSEEEVKRFLDARDDDVETEQTELVEVGGGDRFEEMELEPETAGALSRSWSGYKAAVARLADELEDVREAVINARRAMSAINAIRTNHGQEDLHPDELHDLLETLDDLPEAIPEVTTLRHFEDAGEDEPDVEVEWAGPTSDRPVPEEIHETPDWMRRAASNDVSLDEMDMERTPTAPEDQAGNEAMKVSNVDPAEELPAGLDPEDVFSRDAGGQADVEQRIGAQPIGEQHAGMTTASRRGRRVEDVDLNPIQDDLKTGLVEAAKEDRPELAESSVNYAADHLTDGEIQDAVEVANWILGRDEYDPNGVALAARRGAEQHYGARPISEQVAGVDTAKPGAAREQRQRSQEIARQNRPDWDVSTVRDYVGSEKAAEALVSHLRGWGDLGTKLDGYLAQGRPLQRFASSISGTSAPESRAINKAMSPDIARRVLLIADMEDAAEDHFGDVEAGDDQPSLTRSIERPTEESRHVDRTQYHGARPASESEADARTPQQKAATNNRQSFDGFGDSGQQSRLAGSEMGDVETERDRPAPEENPGGLMADQREIEDEQDDVETKQGGLETFDQGGRRDANQRGLGDTGDSE